jgi:hypothetical protein
MPGTSPWRSSSATTLTQASTSKVPCRAGSASALAHDNARECHGERHAARHAYRFSFCIVRPYVEPSCPDDWLKAKNPDSPAVIRAREAEW